MRLSGKVIFMSGGSRGIGLAVAKMSGRIQILTDFFVSEDRLAPSKSQIIRSPAYAE